MIHVFGDSIAFGHELKDCPHEFIQAGIPQPSSKFSYPSLLNAKNWGNPGCSNEYILRSLTNVISKSDANSIDLVIVQWSFPERFDTLMGFNSDRVTSTGHWMQGKKEKSIWDWLNSIHDFYGPSSKEEKDFITWVELYYKIIYNEDWGTLKLLENIIACQNLFNARNIDYCMLVPSGKILEPCFNRTYDDNPLKNQKVVGYTLNNDIIDLSSIVDWSYFLSYNNKVPYYGILDLAKDNNDIGPHGHPLEETHKQFADELRRRIF